MYRFHFNLFIKKKRKKNEVANGIPGLKATPTPY